MERMIPKKEEHVKCISDIKDVFLKTELEMLVNNWCVQKSNGDYIFFKHFMTNRKGVVYQLVLSGNDYDGLYEVEVFGRNLKLKNIYDKMVNDMVLKFEARSNYDLASFDSSAVSLKIKKSESKDFRLEVKRNLSELSKVDKIDIQMKDGEKISLEQNKLGEIKFRTSINRIVSRQIEDVEYIHIFKKKRPFHISRLDLGEKSFKEELFNRNFITPEEYNHFTSKNKKIYEQFFEKFKKVEII